jgi:hypothetical protein
MGIKTMNFIKEGDKVLIGGFYGDDMKFVNNKLGYVKHIVLINNIVSLSYAAHVQITPMVAVPINFLYLYNTKDLCDFDELLSTNQFLSLFLKSKQVQSINFVVDSEGNHVALCKDRKNTAHYLVGSTLN